VWRVGGGLPTLILHIYYILYLGSREGLERMGSCRPRFYTQFTVYTRCVDGEGGNRVPGE